MRQYRRRFARRSTRLRGYDYARAGAYFITLNAQDRLPLFGTVRDGAVELSAIGQIVAEEWARTPELRPNVALDAFVVMPDHFHAIVVIRQRDPLASPVPQPGELRSPARTLGAVVRGFKGAVVRRVGFPIWQRNYHDSIIRGGNGLFRVRRYIALNPARWEEQ